jgi:NADPH2:quinone reductase
VPGRGRSKLAYPAPAALSLATGTGRIGLSLGIGYEAAGVVIAAGASEAAQGLLGKRAAVFGGGMLAEYCSVKVAGCLVLPENVTSAEGAAAHVNPLTALGIVATVRRKGYSAMVHTAAASALGQMLIKYARATGSG